MSVARLPRAARPARTLHPRRLGAALAALLLAAALLGSAGRASGGTGDVRTLVVRGRVLAPDGTPVSGARVSTRGSATTTATTDDRGRYSLTVPIGSAAGLRRGAFTLEVRAEQSGRRLALGAGASALGIEIALVPGGSRVRVRSNSQEATSAITTAFAQDGAATAWVGADFGGAAHPGGPPVLSAVDEVGADGSPVSAPRAAERAPAPPRRPHADSLPHAAAPAPAAPLAPAPAASAVPAPAVPARESAATAPARPAPPVAPPVAPRVVAVPAPAVTPAPAVARDTLASSAPSPAPRAALAPRNTRAARARARAARARAAREARAAAPAPRVAVTVAPEQGAAPRVAPPPAKPVSARTSGAPDSVAGADTCACRLRGTVEIDWERPLERNFPVEVTLEGPATQHGEVDMFIGSPREFRFGPLPCGDYRLVVRAGGRVHFTLERGDSVMKVPCYGLTQSRVVLVPARR